MVQKIACLHSFVTVKTSSLTAYIITSPFSLHVRLNQTPWGPVRLLSEICTYKSYIRRRKKNEWGLNEKHRGAQKWFSSNSIYHIWYILFILYIIYDIYVYVYTYTYILLLDGLLETIAFLTGQKRMAKWEKRNYKEAEALWWIKEGGRDRWERPWLLRTQLCDLAVFFISALPPV